MVLQRKVCQTCGRELQEGDTVIRVQRGIIGYSQHVSVYRIAATDDYFCEGCDLAVRSIQTNTLKKDGRR